MSARFADRVRGGLGPARCRHAAPGHRHPRRAELAVACSRASRCADGPCVPAWQAATAGPATPCWWCTSGWPRARRPSWRRPGSGWAAGRGRPRPLPWQSSCRATSARKDSGWCCERESVCPAHDHGSRLSGSTTRAGGVMLRMQPVLRATAWRPARPVAIQNLRSEAAAGCPRAARLEPVHSALLGARQACRSLPPSRRLLGGPMPAALLATCR